MGTRFSKARLVEELRAIAHRRAMKFRFDPNNGYAQVTGKGEAMNREYAEWRKLLDLARDIEDGALGVGLIK